MRWVPRKYQWKAIDYILANPFSALFLDPGLGKTSISLSTIKILLTAEEASAVLIIAPLRVVQTTWQTECKKWDNFRSLSVGILHGKSKADTLEERHDIYLINPEGLKWLHRQLVKTAKMKKPMPFDVLWVDESTKFKSPKAERLKIIRTMLPIFRRRHIMTGTPAPKTMLDLWAQIMIIDDGDTLGSSFYKFRAKYFYEMYRHHWGLIKGKRGDIEDLVATKSLTMTAEKNISIPGKIDNVVEVILPSQQMEHYNAMESELFLTMDDKTSTAKSSAAAASKCQQIANGRLYEDPEDGNSRRGVMTVHDAKLTALLDLVEELNGKPVIIAYYYKHDRDSLLSVFGDQTPDIGSGMKQADMEKIIRDWNNRQIPVLLGHPSSAAHGLNLQEGGEDVIWYSIPWSLEDYIQFNNRIHRSGVRGSVRIHHLVAKGTIDEAIMARLKGRNADQDSLKSTLENYRQIRKSE